MTSDLRQGYAEQIVERYKDILNLWDWDIKVKVQTEEDYARKHGKGYSAETNGCADIFQNKKKARIYIKDDLDDQTFENCLIHEIIHIPLNDMYVTGLTVLKELPESDLKLQTCINWEWILEAAVCRLTNGFERLEHEGD